MSEQMENDMEDLRKWLAETADLAPEEMADFFSNRLSGYEQHMAVWEQSYQKFAGLLPKGCRNVLDLGCGTGLELDRIWQKYPDLCVTGVDLCPEMLKELEKKHPEKQLITVCAGGLAETWMLTIQNPLGLKIRPEKQIAMVTGLSASRVKRRMQEGKIEIMCLSPQTISAVMREAMQEA